MRIIWGSGFRDYRRDPNLKALKRRGFINHGSPLFKLFNLCQFGLLGVPEPQRADAIFWA